jgi:ankyrin repeat protein
MSQSGPQWEKEMDWDRINTYIKTHGDPEDSWITERRVSTVPLPPKDYTDELIKFVEDQPQLETFDGNLIPKVDYKLYDRYTLFITAVSYEKYDLAVLFLDMGADINAQNPRGETALYICCTQSNPNLNFIKLLLDKRPNINEVIRFGGTTALLGAIQYGNIDMIKLLLEYGADPNKGDNRKNRPLQSSVDFQQQNNDIAKLLLEYGANINGTNVMGTTALFAACLDENHSRVLENGSAKIDFLLEYGADPFILNSDGENILNNQMLDDDIKEFVADKIYKLHKLNVAYDMVEIAKGIKDDPLQELTDDLFMSIRNKKLNRLRRPGRLQYNPEKTRLRMTEDIDYMYAKRRDPLIKTLQTTATMRGLKDRNSVLQHLREPELMKNIDEHLKSLPLNPDVHNRMMREENENKLMAHYLDDLNQYGSGTSKRRHKYSMKKKRGKNKYGGAGKRKHSDPNDSDDPGEPDYKKMKIQTATQIQSSMRGRQSRQKSKKTKKNIGRRETIYTSHKKNFRDLNSNEKSEIRRRYREHIKSLGEEDELANYLHSKYFRGEEHYTSRPLPLEQIIQEENLHNLGLNLDDASTVELLLELAEINAQLARRDELARRAEMAVLENIDD